MTHNLFARAMRMMRHCTVTVTLVVPVVSSAQPLSVAHPPVPKPSFIIKSNDYPADALRKGISGTVQYVVTVGVDGKAVHCRVTHTSGSAELDDTTCAAVMLRGRYQPATDASGNRVQAEYATSLHWVIPTMK